MRNEEDWPIVQNNDTNEEDWDFIKQESDMKTFEQKLAAILSEADNGEKAMEAAQTILGYAASILKSLEQDSVVIQDEGKELILSLTPAPTPESLH